MNFMERARNLILRPTREWSAIEAEPHSVQGLYTHYVMVLAAIPALCAFIGLSFVGVGNFGATYRMPIAFGVTHLVVGYTLSLGSVYLFALIVEALAPAFGGRKDFMQALKVAAFVPTPAWLSGVFLVIPSLSIIGTLISLDSLVLLYLGLPVVMKVPEDKAIPYIVVALILAIVLAVVIGVIASLTLPSAMRGF